MTTLLIILTIGVIFFIYKDYSKPKCSCRRETKKDNLLQDTDTTNLNIWNY